MPAGTVTFLLTDIEGSTRLWESVPEVMEVALERHSRLLTSVIENHGGVLVTAPGGRATACSRSFPARWRRSRRPAPASWR